jgi:hypothetical protein
MALKSGRPFRERLTSTIRDAENIIKTWPAWKRGILEDSMKSSWDKPRKQVRNGENVE